MTDRINKPDKPKARIYGTKEDHERSLDELKRFSDEDMRKHGPSHAVLNESGEVVPASLMEWAFWFEKSGQRIIQQDHFEDDQYKVSTIFTGLDMGNSFLPNHVPVWFETMVFGPKQEVEWPDGRKRMMRPDLWQHRDSTLKEALETHAKATQWLQDYIKEHASKND